MDEAKTRAKENLQENYSKIKKNGKLYLILFLGTIPGLCFSAVKLHVIKIGARDTVRCEIPSLENSSWNNREIREISHAAGFHEECFIYNYDYNEFTTGSFQEAKNYIRENNYTNARRVICKKFVLLKNDTRPEVFPQEFAAYCETVKTGEIYYDIGAIIPYMLSCLLIAPFADLFGRRRILSGGCHLTFASVFIKILFFDFTRETLGEAIMNFAYPALKYPMQAIIFEITDHLLRPFTFVLTFIGLFIPPFIADLASPIDFKCMHLIAWSPVLFLPLVLWYTPESPMWFASRKQFKAARFASETLNDSAKHNDTLVFLRNKKISLKNVKEHLQELRKINRVEFILINVISICVGFVSLYSYSKHQLMLIHFKDPWMLFLNSCTGFLAFVFSVPCVYGIKMIRILVPAIFFIDGILFSLSANYTGAVADYSTVVLLILFTEIFSNVLKITFEFYLHSIFPTSHRCTCTAVCGAAASLGLLGVRVLQETHVFLSEIVTSIVCIFGCILAIAYIKVLKRVDLIINIDEIVLDLEA